MKKSKIKSTAAAATEVSKGSGRLFKHLGFYRFRLLSTLKCVVQVAKFLRRIAQIYREKDTVCDSEAEATGANPANVTFREQAESRGEKGFTKNQHRDPGRDLGSCSLTVRCVSRGQG